MELATQQSKDWVDQLATIALYCGVIVDGDYYPQELDNLYNILFYKLQSMRSIILQ